VGEHWGNHEHIGSAGLRVDVEDLSGSEVEDQQVLGNRIESEPEHVRARPRNGDLPDNLPVRRDHEKHGVAAYRETERARFTEQRLPPGRLRLVMRPCSTGSEPTMKTIGLVVVGALAAALG
jgi:hypothetical protein